jgi:hypothetical protein
MRDLNALNRFRDTSLEVRRRFGNVGDHTCGRFILPSPIDRAPLVVLASSGGGWDHVSASRANRCPNWVEMDHIKRLFFRDDETAIQFHVPVKEHVSNHPFCLHLWRPLTGELPRPPLWMVGKLDAEAEPTTALEKA